MNNLVVQLLLKTGTFSTDLKKAGGQVQQFKKGCDTAGKSVSAFGKALGVDVGALTKFGGAVGAAVVAGKAMKAMIDSNQTSADAFQGVLYGCKTAVGEFAYAISTFDFTNFNDGLSGLIKRARDAYKEIDQLADTLRGYSVLEAKAAAAVAHARKVARDSNASKADKEAANQAAREAVEAARDGAKEAADQYVATLAAELRAKGANVTNEETLGLVENAIMLNAKAGREAGKARAEAEYDEYKKKMASLDREFGGTSQTYSTNYGTFQYNNEQYKQNPEYQRRAAELAEIYKEGIVYNDVLIKQNDEQLNQTTQMITSVYRLNEQVDTMDSRLEGIENKTNNVTGATKKQEEAVKGSLESWTKVAAEAKKTRDSLEFGTTEWTYWNTQLVLAEGMLEKINEQMDKLFRKQQQEKYKDYQTPMPKSNLKLPGVTDTTNGGGLAGTQKKKTENQLKHELELLYKNRGNMSEDDKNLPKVNQRIEEVTKSLTKLQNLGLPNLSADKKAADSWDYVNEALEHTSTIMTNLMDTFKEGTEVTASSILRMVSTSLPAVYQLATAIMALAGIEATEKAVETSKHWIEAIAAVAALGSVVTAALSTAKSQKFAGGGIVGGNSYTGDRVTAQVNSGEMILNKAQQANLFKMINNGVSGSNQVEFHISGTDLVGVLNNQTRKSNLIR